MYYFREIIFQKKIREIDFMNFQKKPVSPGSNTNSIKIPSSLLFLSIVAYLMQKHGYSAERALAKVRAKREIIQPHESFLAQLRLYENMDFTLDPENLQYKMFK